MLFLVPVQMVLLQHKQRHHLVGLLRVNGLCDVVEDGATTEHSLMPLLSWRLCSADSADRRLPDKATAAHGEAKSRLALPADLLCGCVTLWSLLQSNVLCQ